MFCLLACLLSGSTTEQHIQPQDIFILCSNDLASAAQSTLVSALVPCPVSDLCIPLAEKALAWDAKHLVWQSPPIFTLECTWEHFQECYCEKEERQRGFLPTLQSSQRLCGDTWPYYSYKLEPWVQIPGSFTWYVYYLGQTASPFWASIIFICKTD